MDDLLTPEQIDLIIEDDSEEGFKEPIWKLQAVFRLRHTCVHELRTFYIRAESNDSAEDLLREIMCNEVYNTGWAIDDLIVAKRVHGEAYD